MKDLLVQRSEASNGLENALSSALLSMPIQAQVPNHNLQPGGESRPSTRLEAAQAPKLVFTEPLTHRHEAIGAAIRFVLESVDNLKDQSRIAFEECSPGFPGLARPKALHHLGDWLIL